MAGSGRISVLVSNEMRTLLLAIRELPADLNREIRKHTKIVVEPVWQEAVRGNVVDRLLHGYVVDFLDFHWAFLSGIFHGGHFPAFNIADAGITVGAACLILDELLRVRKTA